MDGTAETPGQQRMITERALQVRQQRGPLRIDGQSFRAVKRRHDADDIRNRLAHCEARLTIIGQRLLNESDAMARSESDEDLLGPLPDEVPSQVAMNDDRKGIVGLVRRGGMIQLQGGFN